MPSNKTTSLLDRLDDARRSFGNGHQKVPEQLLARLAQSGIGDAESIVRFHELLLFICAYPQSARAKRRAESLLKGFSKRIETLRDAEVDLDSLEHPEISGIAGLSVTDTFGFFIVRWLLDRHSSQVGIYWDWFEDENRLAKCWPRLMSLLVEYCSFEAIFPFLTWLRSSRPRSEK